MPECENISLIIDSICKKQEINYSSVNPHYVTLKEDALKMSKMYLQLKEIIGILSEIEERHNFGNLKQKIDSLIRELENADHVLIKIARELKECND